MQISVTFRHLDSSEALKNYVSDRLNKFKRYLDGPVEAHVVLSMEKFRHLADVTIDNNGRIIKGKEENADMYAAIDLVMDKIDMQLKKFRDKLRGVKGDRSRSAATAVEAAAAPARPPLKRKRVEVPALQLSDAVEMMLSPDANSPDTCQWVISRDPWVLDSDPEHLWEAGMAH